MVLTKLTRPLYGLIAIRMDFSDFGNCNDVNSVLPREEVGIILELLTYQITHHL